MDRRLAWWTLATLAISGCSTPALRSQSPEDLGVAESEDALVEEMKVRGVRDPNKVLASGTTALVMVRGYLRPGIQKGDRFDVEVRIPSRSTTTGLRDGWLMETRLKEMTCWAAALR
jgi:flagellar basal body P-ring protein FlgI